MRVSRFGKLHNLTSFFAFFAFFVIRARDIFLKAEPHNFSTQSMIDIGLLLFLQHCIKIFTVSYLATFVKVDFLDLLRSFISKVCGNMIHYRLNCKHALYVTFRNTKFSLYNISPKLIYCRKKQSKLITAFDPGPTGHSLTFNTRGSVPIDLVWNFTSNQYLGSMNNNINMIQHLGSGVHESDKLKKRAIWCDS